MKCIKIIITIFKEPETLFTANKLLLNKDKIEQLIVSTKQELINGNPVSLLGVKMDDALNGFCHIPLLSKKLSSFIFLNLSLTSKR